MEEHEWGGVGSPEVCHYLRAAETTSVNFHEVKETRGHWEFLSFPRRQYELRTEYDNNHTPLARLSQDDCASC
jgi:hypothetical protein